MKFAITHKRISFHCARHTFATILVGLGVDTAVIQKLLGHANIQTTLIYAKVLYKQKQSAIDKWNAV